MNDQELFGILSDRLKGNKITGYAIIVSEDLSAPRDTGAKLIMDNAGCISGTIGGGPLEALVISEMKKMLKTGGRKLLEYDLDIKSKKSIGMMCGGKVKVFCEVYGERGEILLLGGGHVSLAVSRLLDFLGSIPYSVCDDREEFVSKERFPNASSLYLGKFPGVIDRHNIKKTTNILIATRCHAHDIDCLRHIIKKDAHYIGMLASKNKLKEVIEIFKKEKIDLTKMDNFFSPCGLDIGGDTPEDIALSVVSEIMARINKTDGGYLRNRI